MKLVSKSVEKGGSGEFTLIPENDEDMWHAYNLIAVGDCVTCSTIRKVQIETKKSNADYKAGTGNTTSNRVRTTLTISVENIDYDSQACVLRLKGRNVEENKFVKMGAYHTLDLEQNRKFTIAKSDWDLICLERIEMACDPTRNAEIAAVIMQDGLAQVCLITSTMTIVRAKIDHAIPRKRKGHSSQHDKGLNKFYDNLIQSILRHVNFDVVKCVIIASPGPYKDQFHSYMIQQAVKTDNKIITDNKSKFLLVHASSGFKHSLKEVLADPAVISRVSDTKALGEVKALNAFLSTLQIDSTKAVYGKKHVEAAAEACAIETLLISDKLFRCQDVALRKEYISLVESVKYTAGEVKIFSSMHVSGEQLDNYTGVAAILRFPMPELEELEVSADGGTNSANNDEKK